MFDMAGFIAMPANGWQSLAGIATIWLVTTTLTGLLTGWYRLMVAFPNRREEPLLRLQFESGEMGRLGLHQSRTLGFDVCASGLRVRMLRFYGPFCRSFLVPWQRLRVCHPRLFGRTCTELLFGDPTVGRLAISLAIEKRLRSVAGTKWPHSETPSRAVRFR